MKIVNPILKAHISLLIFIFFISCRKDDPPCTDQLNPECPNYDRCLAFIPANAEFVIIDSLVTGVNCNDGRGELYVVSEIDTSVANSDLYFRALHIADTYEWHIGSDPKIHYERNFALYFPNSTAPADITVTLIVCKEIPEGCNAPQCDTLVKKIHLLFTNGADTVSLVIGKFKGVDIDAPLDSFTIDIPPPLPSLVGIINFPKGCIGQYLDVSIARTGFILHPTPTVCQSACGVGNIMPDRKTLVIDYSIKNGNQRVLKKFIGTKIN